MAEPGTERIRPALDEPENSPALAEAMRELQAAEHDAQVALRLLLAELGLLVVLVTAVGLTALGLRLGG